MKRRRLRLFGAATLIAAASACGVVPRASTTDGGEPSIDAGRSHQVDAGESFVDAGAPLADAGVAAIDAGSPAADAGSSPPVDAGPPPSVDGGTTSSIWQPTTAAPIDFHWLLTSFDSTNILPGQAGQTVYDIDGQAATAADVAAIHESGAIAVCYVDVGTLEKGRPDYDQFPSTVIGPAVTGWPGENWLLLTPADQAIILPLMQARFQDWCVAKGFDAIEPDNLDGWTNISNITEANNVTYDLAIAALAHALPLSIGCKNVMTDLDPSQYPSFLAAFDWAINEQCFQYQECGVYSAAGSFLPAGKAVWDVEYGTSPNCTQADQMEMNAQLTDLNLVAPGSSGYKYQPCIPDSQTTW